MDFLIQLANGAVALLIAALAIYLSLRLLGKIAKFAIALIVIAVVLWFVLSDNSILQSVKGLFALLPAPWALL